MLSVQLMVHSYVSACLSKTMDVTCLLIDLNFRNKLGLSNFGNSLFGKIKDRTYTDHYVGAEI